MSQEKTGQEHLTLGQRSSSGRRINPVRMVMWLVAITIVSFAIGFGILALSGGFPPAAGEDFSLFQNGAVSAPGTSNMSLDGARQGELKGYPGRRETASPGRGTLRALHGDDGLL